MNVLLLGSGGREHAMAWKIAQSTLLTRLFIAPGNAGTLKNGINLPIHISDFNAIKQAVLTHSIDMVIVGPEDPLVNGIADFFLHDPEIRHVPVIGPDRKGAMLEGSKDFAKEFMIRHQIPTARHLTCRSETIGEGLKFLETLQPPYVLKADGLAAGKGVMILPDLDQARKELRDIFSESRFGSASEKVVIEEHLNGIELSVFVITDGINYQLLPEAKDYKRIGEGDTGPNTGGMGSVSPVPFADREFMKKVEERIIRRTIQGLVQEDIRYQGFIFFGLMKCGDDPYVIEYNCRLGDPETESVLPRLKNDLLELCQAVANNTLDQVAIEVDPRAAATVMLVSEGYPGAYKKNKPVSGEEEIRKGLIFHAGTTLAPEGGVVTGGGRVMALTSLENTLEDALRTCYTNAGLIRFDGKYFRKDLGFDVCS